MKDFAYFVGGILPPITVAVFIGAIAYRLLRWWKLPNPSLTLFPAPEPGADAFRGVLKATFFFPSLMKADKLLWGAAWIFHATLALVLLGHLRVVSDFPRIWKALGINPDVMSSVIGGLAGMIMLIAALFLILRRLITPRVREITQAGDYFAVLLLLGIIVTGDLMRFSGHFDLEQTREYFGGLILLQLSLPPLNFWFLMHFLLGQTLFLYLPFSKLLHFGGIFFTQTALQRR